MHYLIYQITNKINGKVYIGKHQTKDLNDNYMGSGKLLKCAIKKYGIDNFKKDILYIFDSEDAMNEKEKEIVNKDFVHLEQTYNLCEGGCGGFSYINSNPEKFLTKKRLDSLMKGNSKSFKEKYNSDVEFRNKVNIILKKATEKFIEKYPNGVWLGKKHNQESKLKMSNSHKGKHDGELNSQYGTIWITNGKENKKIKTYEEIPNGWEKGRVLKNARRII
jgi:group I intron endonuclease